MQEILHINYILDKYGDNQIRLSWATDRLVWLKKWKKGDNYILDLLIEKCTLIWQRQWSGDEQIQTEIEDYINMIRKA
jgi:hypothetical protein